MIFFSCNRSGVVKKYNECCEGYFEVSDTNPMVCKPKCEDETRYPITTDDCVNGICKSPNFCECNAGYEKKNGSLFV